MSQITLYKGIIMHKTTLCALVCLTSISFAVLQAMERPSKRHAFCEESTSEEPNTPFTVPIADQYAHAEQDELNRRLFAAALCPSSFAGDAIESLISKGANPNTCNQFGDSALHVAVAARNFFSVKALIEAGAQPNVLNSRRLSPLHYAIDTQGGQSTCARFFIIKLLILKDAQKWRPPEYSPLKHAVVHGDKAACLGILSTMPNVPASRKLSAAIREELLKLELELSLPDAHNVTLQQDALQRGFDDIAALVDQNNTQQFRNMLLGSSI